MVKINRSKSARDEFSAEALYHQAVWPVNFDITGPICARARNLKIPLMLAEARASRLASYVAHSYKAQIDPVDPMAS
jgi:hypothetical protein